MGLTLAMVVVSIFCVVLCISGSTAAAFSTTTTATTASVPTWPDLSGNVSTPTHTTTTTTTTVKSVTTSPELNLWTYLPREWSKICSVDYDVDSNVDATISCHVTASDHAQWRLADLRTSLASLVESSGLEVAVDLQCENGGTISLPFPMRAPGLVKLTVFNCRLLDKYADFATPAQELGDWMRVQDMRDCVWINDPQDLDFVLKNFMKITSHYDCGQDSTLVSYVYRNVSDENSLENMLQGDSALGDLDLSDLDLGDLLAPGDEDLAGLLNGTGDLSGFFGDNNTLGGLGDLLGDPGQPAGGVAADANGSVTGTASSQEITAGSVGGSSGAATSDDLLQTLIDVDQIQSKCLFAQLEVQDESFSPVTNKNHFEFMVKDSKFPKLRLLNYTSIGLTEIPLELRESRRKFPGSQLGVIDLSHNYIRGLGSIPPYPARGVPTTLILQFNNITDISTQLFQEWALVPDYYVDIRNNPIDCSCDLKDLLIQMDNATMWAAPSMAYYRRHLSVMTCATPPGLSGRAIGSLSVDDLPCPVAGADLRPAMAALVVVVIILLLMLVLAVKYRKEVRILMYTRVHILLPCGVPQHLPGDAPEKIYDAFVSYAHQDSEWVLDSLLKRLEEPSSSRACAPCKLCIHQRDFVVGKPIIDNIIDSIAASRHTIIVLSKNFVQSSWAMEELQQAYRQSLEERRRHLVVVVLEDVAQSDMAPVLRRCCKTFTYLHVSDSLFWDRLLYSIHIESTAANNDKNKGSRTQSTTSDQYDDIGSAAGDKKGGHSDAQNGGVAAGEGSAVSQELKAVFVETMRAVSVDSTCSTASETGVPVTPSQCVADRPLFESRA